MSLSIDNHPNYKITYFQDKESDTKVVIFKHTKSNWRTWSKTIKLGTLRYYNKKQTKSQKL